MSDSSNAEPWQSRFKLDLKLAKAKHLTELVAEFERWRNANPVTEPLSITNGWHLVTPAIAEEWLRRNPSGANRKLSFATVHYYSGQMQRTDWLKTGQPVIFTSDGVLLDGQHRLWAAYLSGASFSTYVVCDVEPQPLLFAYVDNGKTRSPADALATAGMNGQSSVISKILRIIEYYEHDCYTPARVQKLPRMSPSEFVHFGEQHPLLQQAALLMASDYVAATRIIGHREIAGFVALRILELHGETVLDEFMSEVGTPTDEADYAITAFQEVMRKDRDKKGDRLPSYHVLGYLVKTFNAWLNKEPVKRLGFRAHEQFPRVAEKQLFNEAAE